MPRAKPSGTKLDDATLQRNADIPAEPLVTLRYSAEDMQKLDQFATGLLGDTSASRPGDGILESRIRSAYLRAEVMLTIHKEIAALEIQDETV